MYLCLQKQAYHLKRSKMTWPFDDKVTRKIYLHITKKTKKEAAQKFDELMNSFFFCFFSKSQQNVNKLIFIYPQALINQGFYIFYINSSI